MASFLTPVNHELIQVSSTRFHFSFYPRKGFTAIWLFVAFIEIESIIKVMRKNTFKLKTSSTL
jgi:hypothetical protein